MQRKIIETSNKNRTVINGMFNEKRPIKGQENLVTSSNPYGANPDAYARYSKRRNNFIRSYGRGLAESPKAEGFDRESEYGNNQTFRNLEKNKMFQDQDVASDIEAYDKDSYNSSPSYWDERLAKSYGGNMNDMINAYGAKKVWNENEYENRKYKFEQPVSRQEDNSGIEIGSPTQNTKKYNKTLDNDAIQFGSSYKSGGKLSWVNDSFVTNL